MEKKYIVVYTLKNEVDGINEFIDNYNAFIEGDNKNLAQKFYDSLFKLDNLYIASLTEIISSTDY